MFGIIGEQLVLVYVSFVPGNTNNIHFFVRQDVVHIVPKVKYFFARRQRLYICTILFISLPGVVRIRSTFLTSVGDAFPDETFISSCTISKVISKNGTPISYKRFLIYFQFLLLS